MARTNATNFSGGLQFPYATAAADLFKKEDVQVLAQAVDQHDHSTGKGLALNGITSAMIADGTIQTVDLAAGSISQSILATGVTSDPTTTSSSKAVLPDMTLSLSGVSAGGTLLVSFAVVLSNTTSSAQILLYASFDGTDTAPLAMGYASVANDINSASAVYCWTGVTAGTHQVRVLWSTSAGTAKAISTYRTMTFTELKK